MRIVRHTEEQLVLAQRRNGMRAIGACLLAAAVALMLLKSSGQQVRCERGAEGPVCVFTERTLSRVTSVERITAADVQQIEVVSEADGDDESHCVMIATAGGARQFGRCSAKREARLTEAVDRLRAFYAGERPTLESELSDAPMLWFMVVGLALMGLLFVAPGSSRLEIDRKQGELMFSSRRWLLARRKQVRVPLTDVREVSVIEGLGEDGDERVLVVRLSDGRRISLHARTRRSLSKEHQLLSEFLARDASGYR